MLQIFSFVKQLPPKHIIFYLAIFIFTIWGSLNSYQIIYQYLERAKEPKSLINLYVYRGNFSLFQNLIFLFIFNGCFVFYLVRNLETDKLINAISIFMGIMFLFFILKSWEFFPFEHIPDNLSFFYLAYVLGNILFDCPYATINQTILCFWLIIFFLFKSKITNRHKAISPKSYIIFTLLLIDMVFLLFLFPHFLIK